MAQSTIEWTESTWNPLTGCDDASPGCENCYARRMAHRLQAMGVYETERSVANKMSRGTFSFVFFLQCMKAMGASSISFELMVDIPTLGRRR